ncbi:SGNH/GDSL hydrolase family protein [Desulfovibrio mangrovi]|uniref:SGNH/GDSL hydrolase family protein n=1 Tax=Desulfovibrio mangrovi TaxID=2976983 RepID=UPI002246DF5F|nr:SGNH/GDSL hydrolase family protein [Desulfovibrio mangrovi]UZP68120.1 SGNH/GDSL hydrolase family protein [Desulfovibrio mangrovi]
MPYLLLVVLILVLVEVKTRRRYWEEHGVPFQIKRVGEYPYNEFIRECGPPLHWTLKPDYASRQVHINTLGQRGPEPETGRRKIWVVGESELFGAKLSDENRIWFRRLQRALDDGGYDYQVMNASVIGYNALQTAESFMSLPLERGDLVLVRPNMNELSLAYMQGAEWQAGTPWPIAFIHKLQRSRPWYHKLLDCSCLATLVRRRISADDERARVFTAKPGFQRDRLVGFVIEQLERMVAYAEGRGATVALFDAIFSYDREVQAEDEAKLAAIQSNWRHFVEGWSSEQYDLMDQAVAQVAAPKGLPVLRTAPHVWRHPLRYRLYLDLVHFNAEGHEVLGDAFFNELCSHGLLQKGDQ